MAKISPSGSQLLYATYLGGSDFDHGQAIAVDDAGEVYVMGVTGTLILPSLNSMPTGQIAPVPIPKGDFPVTPGAFRTQLRGSTDIFVTKLNRDGTVLGYSTFLGGASSEGLSYYGFYSEGLVGRAIIIDAARNAYVTGTTFSTDFPTTPGAFRSASQGSPDAFITKLNASGSGLIYSTYLGGNAADIGNAIALDSLGNAYVTGLTLSGNFPVTQDAFPGLPVINSVPAFITKINKTGSALSYSTYFGGSGRENATCIAVNSAGSAFIGGSTSSLDFPITGNSFQRNLKGEGDGFIARVVPGVSGMVLSRILPNSGGDAGSVSALVQGLGFQDGATVRLTRTGEADIVGTLINVSADGRTIGTLFNLSGKTRGNWDVVVTNPDGVSNTISGGFTIEAGREASIIVDIPWGFSLIRSGQKQWYYIHYRNPGNNDIYGSPIWVKVKGSQNIRLVSEINLPAPLPGEPPLDLSAVNTVFGTPDGALTLAVMPAILPPGRSGYFTVEVTAPSQIGSQITMEAWANPPVFRQLENPGLNFHSCYLSIIKLVGERTGIPIPASCDVEIRQAWLNIIAGAVQQSYLTPNKESQLLSLPQVITAISSAVIRCAGGNVQLINVINDVSDVLWTRDELNKCFGAKISYVVLTITVVRAYDPNDKIGVQGVGAGRYIQGNGLLNYAILFENIPTATAPAQEVVITDQLDISTMDLSTFSFGPITFGTHQEIPTPGLTDFTTDVDLRPEKNLIVRIVANLDPVTGLLVWRLTSLDSATNQPPTDPMAGFLPPNINSPEGAGVMLFSIRQKVGLASGTKISNRASIVFDQNAPIQTPVWINTIDQSKPASQVAALPATQLTNSFEVKWAGTDSESGIADYSIFVSVDNGPYQLWLTTTATTAIYTRTAGNRISFYSIARDRVGNIEDSPATPDTFTTLQNYDYSLQDDRTGDFLLINTRTGDYVFSHCGIDSFTLIGTGRITYAGCSVSISSPLVNATLKICATIPFMSGEARVKRNSAGPAYFLFDRDLSNNSSVCR